MSGPVLCVTLAGRSAAIDAAAVHSVVALGALTPVPRAPAHILGLAALRSRTLTVIDSRAALGLAAAPGPLPAGQQAVITDIDGHAYALLVDDVAGVSDLAGEPEPIIGRAGPGWERVARGAGDTAFGPALLIDLPALVAGLPAMAA